MAAPSFPPFLWEEMGAPAASEAPGALPIKIQRSHLQKSGAFLEGVPSMNGRPQVAPTDGAPSRRAPRGKREDDIRPYGVSAPDGTAFYNSLRISCRLRSYSSGVMSFCS